MQWVPAYYKIQIDKDESICPQSKLVCLDQTQAFCRSDSDTLH